ncbi:hypothetical protein TPAR_06590, partial [Tolypocladium paradoxum]
RACQDARPSNLTSPQISTPSRRHRDPLTTTSTTTYPPLAAHIPGHGERQRLAGRGQGPLQLPERHHRQPGHREAQLGRRVQGRAAVCGWIHEHCAGEDAGVRQRHEAARVWRRLCARQQRNVHFRRLMRNQRILN